MRVTSKEFLSNYRALSERVKDQPLLISEGGQDSFVLLSAGEYERLKRRDRRVVRLEDFTDEEMEAIAKGEAPAAMSMDAEVKDWHP